MINKCNIRIIENRENISIRGKHTSRLIQQIFHEYYYNSDSCNFLKHFRAVWITDINERWCFFSGRLSLFQIMLVYISRGRTKRRVFTFTLCGPNRPRACFVNCQRLIARVWTKLNEQSVPNNYANRSLIRINCCCNTYSDERLRLEFSAMRLCFSSALSIWE